MHTIKRHLCGREERNGAQRRTNVSLGFTLFHGMAQNGMAYLHSVALFSGTERYLYLTLTKIGKKDKKM